MKKLEKERRRHPYDADSFLLGETKDGIRYWLSSPYFWMESWYFGSVTALSKKGKTVKKESFGSLFLNGTDAEGFEQFNKLFYKTPLKEKEVWELLELMRFYYTASTYAEALHNETNWQMENPYMDFLKSDRDTNRMNKTVIPAINKSVLQLLKPTE